MTIPEEVQTAVRAYKKFPSLENIQVASAETIVRWLLLIDHVENFLVSYYSMCDQTSSYHIECRAGVLSSYLDNKHSKIRALVGRPEYNDLVGKCWRKAVGSRYIKQLRESGYKV